MVWPKIIQSNIFQRFGNNLNYFEQTVFEKGLDWTCMCIPSKRKGLELGFGTLDLPREHE